MTRGLRTAVVLCLAGAAALLVAGGRTWAVVQGDAPAPLPAVETALRGADLAPGLRALALVGLAGVAALVAARARLRPVVGLLLAAAGAGAGALVLRVLGDPRAAVLATDAPVSEATAGGVDLGAGPWLGLLGAVLLVAAGLLVLARGRRWAGLTARYEAPAARPPRESDAWDALDRGADPTADPTSVPDRDQPRAQQEDPR